MYTGTPIHFCSVVGATICFLYLLKRGQESLEAEDRDGNTPLALALVSQHPNFAIMLIQKGSSVQAQVDRYELASLINPNNPVMLDVIHDHLSLNLSIYTNNPNNLNNPDNPAAGSSGHEGRGDGRSDQERHSLYVLRSNHPRLARGIYTYISHVSHQLYERSSSIYITLITLITLGGVSAAGCGLFLLSGYLRCTQNPTVPIGADVTVQNR